MKAGPRLAGAVLSAGASPRFACATSAASPERLPWVDLLRVIACVMVIAVHASSRYFFGLGDPDRHFWGNLYGSLARPGMPLFVVISGALLLPLRTTARDFLRRRLGRVMVPLLVWATIYAFLPALEHPATPGQALRGWAEIFLNYPPQGLHLWYLYVLIGLYLFMPVVSPWLAGAGRGEELAFLGLWGVALLLPFLRRAVPALWGEAPWNGFGALHYFSGYLGYLVLGHFLIEHWRRRAPWILPAALALFVAGYLATFASQQWVYARHGGSDFSLWGFTSVNVALMVATLAAAVQQLGAPRGLAGAAIAELSRKSFGIFLAHYYVVYKLQAALDLTGLSPALAIPLNTVVSFLASYGIVKAISLLPGSRHVIG